MKYCKMCGAELKDEAKFCAQCGAAAIEPAQPETAEANAVEEPIGTEAVQQSETSQQAVAWQEPIPPTVPFLANPLFLGILFVISGVLMLLLPTIPVMDMMETYAYGTVYMAAATVANNVISSLESFIFQAPALIAIVTGIALMQKRRGAFKLAMLGGIFQLLAAIGSLFIMIIVLMFADPLVELYVWDAETVAIGTQLLRGEGMSRFLMVELPLLIIGVASFVFTLIARGKERKTGTQIAYDLFDKMPRSAVSLIILIPFIMMFFTVKGLMSTLLMGQYFGSELLAASSSASAAIATYTIPAMYLVVATIVYCMLGYKWKKTLLVLPGMGVFLVYGIVVTAITVMSGRELLITMNTPEVVMGYTQSMLTPQILAHALMALALFFWIAASGRGCIPAWLQGIIAPIAVILYIVMEPVCTIGFAVPTLPIAQYVLYLIILAFSIPIALLCKPKKG